ncbi:hypothetical protein FACS1894122_10750 [Alphaproteobacteria bacterium]|nr:hypothetical protein FACS1894122_10750 [Alphaproteobacteria bacterium]
MPLGRQEAKCRGNVVMNKRISLGIVSSIMLVNVTLAETFKMKNEVIHANISFQHLNRICVKNDRIATISGLENAFHFEKNEKTGEGFIRATVENGHEPISISITTISGKTQDMLLNVVDGEPNVIELEDTETVDVTSINDVINLDDCSNNGNGYEESLIESMKRFILSVPKLSKLETDDTTDSRNFAHIKAEFQTAHRSGGFWGFVFEITTDKEETSRIDERMFSRIGDVALSLSNLFVSKNKPAILYVLRK